MKVHFSVAAQACIQSQPVLNDTEKR